MKPRYDGLGLSNICNTLRWVGCLIFVIKMSLFLRSVCDDFVARTASIEIDPEPEVLEGQTGSALPAESVIVAPGQMPDVSNARITSGSEANFRSESVVAPDLASLQSDFVTSENQFDQPEVTNQPD